MFSVIRDCVLVNQIYWRCKNTPPAHTHAHTHTHTHTHTHRHTHKHTHSAHTHTHTHNTHTPTHTPNTHQKPFFAHCFISAAAMWLTLCILPSPMLICV